MKNILLIHQYAGNKGDRAVLFAFCNMIKSKFPECCIRVSTSDPAMWNGEEYFKKNGVIFVPSAWDFQFGCDKVYWKFVNKFRKYTFTILRESLLLNIGANFARLFINPLFCKAAKESDLTISVGGHHFTTILSRDLVSSINYDSMATLMLRKPFICFSQSFGPFEFHNERNSRLTRMLLSSCGGLYTREEKSVEELIALGMPADKIFQTYESVISLNLLFEKWKPINEREDKVGIAIYCAQSRTQEARRKYVENMVKVADGLNERGLSVVFFPMELKGSGPDDRHMIQEILSKVQNQAKCSLIEEDMDTLKHLKAVEKCKVFIGHKTHSTIFALLTGTPLIGIAYHPKTREFMRQFGFEDNCIDDKFFDAEPILAIYDRMSNQLEKIGESQFNTSKEMALKIHEDFKSMFKHR